MDASKYNSNGVASPQPLGSDSPGSNPGLIYQPANKPTSPGSFLPGQTVSLLTFQANVSGRRIRISMNDIPKQAHKDPGQLAGSIAIIDSSGVVLASLGTPLTGDTNNETAFFQNNTGGAVLKTQQDGGSQSNVLVGNLAASSGTGVEIDMFGSGSGIVIVTTGASATGRLIQLSQNNVLNTNFPLTIANSAAVSTHFTRAASFIGKNIYVSDGTTPNGNLTGATGDICLDGTGGALYFCVTGTTWTPAGGTTIIGGTTALYSGSVVSGAAGTNFPAGWSVTNPGAGLYEITHTLGVSNYSVQLTPNVFASREVSVYNKTSTLFDIAIANLSGTATNTDFDFILTY